MIVISLYLSQKQFFLNPYQCACLWSMFYRLKHQEQAIKNTVNVKKIKININIVNLNEINQSVL